MSRTPACEDSGIAERLAEIQRERMQRIAGCVCGSQGPAQHDVAGNLVHSPQCPLRQAGAAQMASDTQIALVLAAVERLRARRKHRHLPSADELMAEGIAEKYARHRVLLPALLAMALAFDPHVLTLSWGADRPQETVAATSRSTCEQAADAIRSGRWLADDPPLAMACRQGSAFPKGWDCIERFNCRGER